MVAKTALKALGSSQEEVDDGMLTAIARFLREVLNQSFVADMRKKLCFLRPLVSALTSPSFFPLMIAMQQP